MEYFREEHELFRASLRDFLHREVVPNIDEWEKEKRIPREIWKKMGAMGYHGLSYPKEYGGSDLDFFFDVVFNEELGRINCGGFTIAQQASQYMAGPYIVKYGSEAIKQKYLPGIVSGELIGCIGITEPGAGSDTQKIQTKAIKKGNYYVVDGSKTFITNAYYGDFVVAVVKTDPDKGAKGVSLLVIDLNSEGIQKSKLNKLGWHCSDTAELSFDSVKVPAENLIGKEGSGFKYLMNGLQLERLCFIPSSVSSMEYAIEISMEYMSERKAFGSALDTFQVLRHRIAQLSSEVEALKAFGYYCCSIFGRGMYDVKLCSMAKLICTELHEKVATQCLQFYGGYGYMEDYPMARMYRDVRAGTIGAGTSEIMHEIISKMIIDDVEYEKEKETGASSDKFFYNPIGPLYQMGFDHRELFRNSTRKFINKEVIPNINGWKKEGKIPKEIYKKFGQMGYFGLAFEQKYGGSNSEIWYTVIILEEISRVNPTGFAAALASHFYLSLMHINTIANENQKQKYLVPGIKGDLIGCIAFEEPFMSFDSGNIKTTAVKNGENYVINGSKNFIANSINSDYILVPVKMDPNSKSQENKIILVERDRAGLKFIKSNKLGSHTSDMTEISFENVKVPIENLLGDQDKEFDLVGHSVYESLSMATISVGTSQFALETTLKYLKEREVFGDPLAKFQVLRHRIAKMASEIELNRQFLINLYTRFEKGDYLFKEALMAKLIATQLCDRVTLHCFQMFGGNGPIEEYPITRIWRDSKSKQIGGGTSEILCEIISKAIIDRKGFNSVKTEKKKQTSKI